MIPALITAGLSIGSGLLNSASQAKANKKARQQQIAADVANRDALDRTNADNLVYGRALRDTPITTTTVNRSSGRDIVDVQHSGGVHTSYKEWGDVDVDNMMAAAERAGFNPVTWLNAGGLGAYSRRYSDTQTTDTTKIRTTSTYGRKDTQTQEVMGAHAAAGYSLMSPQTFQMGTAPQTAVQSPMGAVVNGLSDGFKAWNDDRVRSENQDFQREQLNLSLDAAQRRVNTGRASLGGVPGIVTSGGITSNVGRGGLARHGGVGLDGRPTTTEAGDRKSTNPFPTSSGIRIDTDNADAEQGETRYGDIAQEFFGLKNMIDDSILNLTGKTKSQRYERTKGWYNAVGDYIGGLVSPDYRTGGYIGGNQFEKYRTGGSF